MGQKIGKKQLNIILKRAKDLKKYRKKNKTISSLKGVNLAMIFEKPSTRTRVSFELAIKELGGNSIVLDEATTHLSRGETIEDTARVLARYCKLQDTSYSKGKKQFYDKHLYKLLNEIPCHADFYRCCHANGMIQPLRLLQI